MNVTKKILAMLFVASLFVFTGCTKDDDNETELVRVENNLVEKARWNFEKAVGEDGTPDAFLNGFLAGSHYVFNLDKTYVYTLTADNVTNGSWNVSADGKTLTLTPDGGGNPLVRTIVAISGSNLTIEYTDGGKKVQLFYN